ncbi:MAG: PAS domain-containing protein [Deltaproteobacteria bacterium]|nr:PAS domain-containing protein [Deltaproteobacteria bacterium]
MIDEKSKDLLSYFEAFVELYAIDEDFVVEYMCASMIKRFGYGLGKKCHEVLHQSDEICPWCRAKDIFSGQCARWEHHIPRIDRTFDLVELPLLNSDGTRTKIALFKDITEQIRTAERIRVSEEDYQSLFEHVGCGVFISTKDGRFLDANPALLDMLGYGSKEEFLQIDIATDLYLHPEDRRRFQQLIERDGRVIDYELEFKRKDGTPIPILLTGHVRYDSDGHIVGYEGINVDLSPRKQMEAQLRNTQEQLLQSEKLAAMGRLTSQIAHELNNPLYGIMNTLELLKTEIPPQNKRRKILEMALSETVRLSDLLHKMLSFSKPDEEQRQPVDINVILDEILLLVSKQLQEHGIKISTHLEEDLARVYASKNQLRQVFLNLISNARDAMPEGGVLTIKTKSNREHIYVEVIDTGLGIREEHLDKIFDAFFTTKEGVKGVGLGLSVCYGFIKEHGGDIQVSSKSKEGAAFTIILPKHIPEGANP